jgi:autotransporter-associated beta strand protein
LLLDPRLKRGAKRSNFVDYLSVIATIARGIEIVFLPRNYPFAMNKKPLLSQIFFAISIAALAAFVAEPTFANTATWTGGSSTSNNWNDTTNWSGGVQPTGGAANSIIHYTQGGRTTSNNDYGDDSQFQQILFDNTISSSSYSLTGSRIKLFNNGGTGKIENNSSILQTVSFSGGGGIGILLESSYELDPTLGDLTINNTIQADFNAPTISVFGGAGHVLTLNGVYQQNTGAGTVGSITNESNNIIVFNAANTYTGNTTIKAGEVRFGQNGSSNNSTLLLGDTANANNATVTLSGINAQTLSSAMTVQSGNTGIETLKSQNTSGTSQWNGTITLNKGLTVASTNSGGTLQLATVTAGSAQTLSVGDGSTTNAGTVSLAGSSDNVNIAATVNSGTLLLAKASNSGVHALGSGLTVNSGGTAKLGGTGGDQIFDSMAVTLNAGATFNTSGLSEGTRPTGPFATNGAAGIGALSLAGTSGAHVTLDFGTLGGSTLAFGSLAAGANTFVDILNWDGNAGFDNGSTTNDRWLFATDPGLSQAQLANFDFAGFAPGATEFFYGNMVEIVPVPEPSTWVAGGMTLLSLLFLRRRRTA